jgi:outer membrane protein insertion porin family
MYPVSEGSSVRESIPSRKWRRAVLPGECILTFAMAARWKAFPSLFKLIATVCSFLLAAQTFAIQHPQENSQTKYFIERIDLIGNRRVETATVAALVSSHPGDPYSVEAVQRDAQALRDTPFFDDVRLEVEDSPDRPNGKVVVFIVREKAVIGRIEYKGIQSQSITQEDIVSALNDKNVGVSAGSWFDEKKMKHAAAVIRELLAAHGHPSAMVKPTYEKSVSSNTVSILFNIDEGQKAQTSTHPTN